MPTCPPVSPPLAEQAANVRRYTAALPLLETRLDDLELGLNLFEQHSALGAFHSVLAALTLNRRAEALVSADRAFAEVAGLRWVNPATRDLDDLIGR